MQWGLIFGKATVIVPFSKLSRMQKAKLIAAYLHRQIRLLREFDDCYDENLTSLFFRGLEPVINSGTDHLKETIDEIEARVPDTEEFSEQAGAYAQNIMIALMYLLLYVQSGREEELVKCVDSALNNIDLINYEIDENYSESNVVSSEVMVVENLLNSIAKLDNIDAPADLSNLAMDMI